jgi:hypothetical protein
MAQRDTANAKKLMGKLNTLGGGATGAGLDAATLAAQIPGPVVDVNGTLEDCVANGYCNIIGHRSTGLNDWRDAVYQVTASGITFSNS